MTDRTFETDPQPEHPVRFHHFPSAGTIAVQATDDPDFVRVGVALLAEGDQFSRPLGRTIAEGRLRRQRGKLGFTLGAETFLMEIVYGRLVEAGNHTKSMQYWIRTLPDAGL